MRLVTKLALVVVWCVALVGRVEARPGQGLVFDRLVDLSKLLSQAQSRALTSALTALFTKQTDEPGAFRLSVFVESAGAACRISLLVASTDGRSEWLKRKPTTQCLAGPILAIVQREVARQRPPPRKPPRRPPSSKKQLVSSGSLERYKWHVTRAEVLKRRGRLRAALRHLGLARRVMSRPPLLFDFGAVHLKLAMKHRRKRRITASHLRRAKSYFKQYLRRAPRGKLAARARAGLRDVARLRPTVGSGSAEPTRTEQRGGWKTVQVDRPDAATRASVAVLALADGRPVSATVSVDGRHVGEAPLLLRGLRAGMAVVVARHSGHLPARRRVRLVSGKETKLVLHLRPSSEGRRQTTGPTRAQREQVASWMRQARRAYVGGGHRQAMVLARKVLRILPAKAEALQIVGASASYTNDVSVARSSYRRLDGARRRLLRNVCNRKGIALE